MRDGKLSIGRDIKFFALLSAMLACFVLAFIINFVMGITIVYTHFFYIPILLAGMWYQRKAVYVAIFLGVLHILMAYLSSGYFEGGTFERAAIFILVAYAIGFISEQRAKGENALRESEEKYRAFFKTSEDPVFITSKDGRWIDMNDAAVELIGYESKDELFKVRVPDIYENPEERKRHTQIIDQEGFTKDFPVNLRRKDGGIINTLITSVVKKDVNGNVIGYQGIIRDITERKQAEEELKQYQFMVESAHDAIFFKDLKSRYIIANDKTLESFGLSREEVIGKDDYELMPDKKEAKKNVDDDQEVFKTGKPTEIIKHMSGADGEEYWFQAVKVPHFDTDGNITGLIGIARDVTERKRAEKEREQLLKELEAKNTELEHFTYTISHDLSSPLMAIRGFAEILREDLEQGKTEDMESYLERIESAAVKMDKLLNDTLELSRIGRVANPPEDVPFRKIVEDALEQTAEQIKSSGVEVSMAEDFPTVHVDCMRIAEVLVNLIGNSIRYRGEQPHPKIEIGYRVEGEETVFFVQDNGIGIDPSMHDKVFDLFYRVDKSGEGSGAGLAIVKRIVEVHNGRIWIESEKGKGCTVCFTLPAQ